MLSKIYKYGHQKEIYIGTLDLYLMLNFKIFTIDANICHKDVLATDTDSSSVLSLIILPITAWYRQGCIPILNEETVIYDYREKLDFPNREVLYIAVTNCHLLFLRFGF